MNDQPDHESTDEGGHDLPLADHPLTAGRLAQHQARVAEGAYPYRYERTATASALHDRYGELDSAVETEDVVSVAGRVMLLRSFGKLVFVTLQDATGRIQLFIDRRSLGDDAFAALSDVDLGDWLGATGTVMTTKKGELSVKVADFELLQKSLRPLPDKWHGLQDIELRSRRRYVDLIVNEDARETALARAAIVSELRRQFEDRGYIEVETPVLLAEATGALARPFQTHHHALGQDMYLRIATELFLKRLVVGGIERVFEIGRIFRNEGIDSTHNPEFTMLESYEAFADYGDIATMVETIVSALAEKTNGSTRIQYEGRDLDLTPPFRRARMVDLVAEAVGRPVEFDQPLDEVVQLVRGYGIEPEPHWGHGKLIEELFDELVADEIWEPTYVMDHPKEISPLAREHRDDPDLTERWELFIAGAEYANAFSELNDPLDQRRRFEAQAAARAGGDAEAHPIDEDYLLALEYGLPPTGGLGIGVDRLVMLLTNQHHIREVILFPTLRTQA
ncbi:MAG: lysine--tRNA ligase [Acidimicrobiia bacterium]|nr:lysine--tRNA ligase [Acidimicrobiia bacterium]